MNKRNFRRKTGSTSIEFDITNETNSTRIQEEIDLYKEQLNYISRVINQLESEKEEVESLEPDNKHAVDFAIATLSTGIKKEELIDNLKREPWNLDGDEMNKIIDDAEAIINEKKDITNGE